MKFLLFDCDGVLVDTEAIAAKVVTNWLNEVNCEITEVQFLNEHTGKTFGSIFKELVDNGTLSQSHWKEGTILSLEEIIYEKITKVDGITDCLKQLNDYKKAVISNSRESMVRKALKVTNLDDFFDPDSITTAERVKKPKPDPGVYLFALDRFNLKSNDCIAIEDSLSGVKAASAAGIYTIGFAGASHLQKGHDMQLLKAGASAIAYHAREIPELVKLLN